jgi:exopolysaccharide biosynthesis polyprenyl glycosylphosphotransferase
MDFVATLRNVLDAGKWFVTLTLVWWACATFLDCYDLARAASTTNSVSTCATAALVTVLVYTLIPWLTPPLHSRSLIFGFAGLALGGVVSWRVFYARVFVQPWFKQRALVVGAGRSGRHLAAELRRAPQDANPYRGTGYRLIGFIDDNNEYHGVTVEGVPVLGGSGDLVSLAQDLEIDEVIVAITHRHAIADALFAELLRCRELGLRVTTMSALYERLLGRVPVEHVGRDLHMVLPMEETAAERLYHGLKRLVDLGFAVAGLMAMAWLVPLVALVNALTSPGPLFYRQTRVGKGGRHFQVFKFRTMYPDAEKGIGAVWACLNDERATLAGRLLRRSRLDELPQVLNVLRGEMSVIGPRPERPEFVEQLAEQIPFYRLRHSVRPGITGWAQMRFRYGSSVEDAKVKLEYDLYYIKHAGPSLDANILLRTLPVMLRMEG